MCLLSYAMALRQESHCDLGVELIPFVIRDFIESQDTAAMNSLQINSNFVILNQSSAFIVLQPELQLHGHIALTCCREVDMFIP